MTTEDAAISRGGKISAVWIIPLLALAMGGYMVVHTLMTEGPEIEIAFTTANGLEAGKTKVKYRNVEMGLVESVRLNDDFDGVIAMVKMDRQALPMLREDTRFWVVTARVGVGNISGLDTLLSGAYIQLAPGSAERGTREFVALEQPPLTPTGAPGLRLQLTSKRASSVSTGDSVLYNGYKVGRVESMKFDPDKREVHYVIFIDAPYHDLVNSSVRFWDVSGVSLSAGADGFNLDTGSLDTVLLGGVAFGLPEGIGKGEPVEHNTEFSLYPSYDDILKNPYSYGTYYVVSFTQSIKGLLPGAPVEYRGIPIGRVERIMLKESIEELQSEQEMGTGGPIPILIYVEPARMALPDKPPSIDTLHKSIVTGIQHGLRATLESGNLLTGAKYIGMDYYTSVDEATIGAFQEYRTIPTIDAGLGQIMQKVTSILDKVDALPLDQTVDGANAVIETLNKSLQDVNALLVEDGTQGLPNQLNETLQGLSAALEGMSPDSTAYQSLNSSLLRLNRTLGNLESMTQTLATQPNAVLMPSNSPPDPVPEIEK